LAEEAFSPVPGITHRYPDRCLMVVTNSCAIYCRYCTRKRIMGEDVVSDLALGRMIDYIARTPAIRDVVVSGGDPLGFATDKLDRILSRLRAIPHVEIIRIGSRVPVALPMRIDDELTGMLARHHPLWINVHFNHPREITPDAARACDRLSRAGIPLNNQAVLLRGINDDERTQRELCQGLMLMRVRPYYLYHCDPVRGADHFRTTIARGVEIIETLRGHTSGLAVPQFVVDAPGGGGKVPINPQYVLSYEDGRALLRNYQGRVYEANDASDLPGGSLPGPKLADADAGLSPYKAPGPNGAAGEFGERTASTVGHWVHPRR
jgi:lysine 2,3-aminomutase